MVLDQVWVHVADFECRIERSVYSCSGANENEAATSNSSDIVVRHGCAGDTLRELVAILRAIFKGKTA